MRVVGSGRSSRDRGFTTMAVTVPAPTPMHIGACTNWQGRTVVQQSDHSDDATVGQALPGEAQDLRVELIALQR